MKTGIIYARYSSDRQTEQSIEGQLRICNDYAERNGITVIGTYIDRAMTGTNDNRADFQRMMKDSDKRLWDYVIVYKLDRFSRNKYEMAIHRKRLKDNGIKIISAMENIPDSPEGILLESLLEGMNQYYSEELSQKTRRGLKETLLKGKLPGGRVAYGWDKTPDRKAVINEAEANIVREIFNMYLNGMTMQKIADTLNERGIINQDRPFLQSTIYTMLHNEKYVGIMRVRDEMFEGVYPPIITKEIFEKTQALLLENSTGKHVPDVTYLLRGMVLCGYCGKRYNSAGGADRYGYIRRYYTCPHKGCTGHRGFRKSDLEDIVLFAIRKVFRNEDEIEKIATATLKMYKDRAEANATITILEKELEKVNKSISGLLKAVEMGIITESTKERLEELEKQRRELRENIAIEKANVAIPITKEQIKANIHKAIQENPKRMIDMLIEKVVVYREYIEITFKYVPNGSPNKTIKWHRYSESPDLNDRGSFYAEISYNKVATEKYDKTLNTNLRLFIRL